MAGRAKAPGCGEYNRKNALARQIYTIRRGGLLPNYHILGWKAPLGHSNRTSHFATLIPGRSQVDRSLARRKKKTDATASTIPFTSNSHAVACVRIQMMATIASAGTIFIPGKLKGCAPSARTSRCTKNQHAAQQSRYIRRTATLESTASFSNVPVMDRVKASTAYVIMATSGER